MRDALAVMAATLRGDEEGVRVLLDACDARAVAEVLAPFAAEAVRLSAGRTAPDGALADLVGVHLLRLVGEAP